MEEMAIQKMEMEDLEDVFSMEAASSLAPWSRQMFIAEIVNPCAHCFCSVLKSKARSEDQVLGFICFRNVREESELLNLCVHPAYRRIGVGKKLMTFYVDFCSQRKIERAYLEVSTLNPPALRLYQLFSYETIGVRKKFYQGRIDALLMMRRV